MAISGCSQIIVLAVQLLIINLHGCQLYFTSTIDLHSNNEAPVEIRIINQSIGIQLQINHHAYCTSPSCNILHIARNDESFLSLYINGISQQYVLAIEHIHIHPFTATFNSSDWTLYQLSLQILPYGVFTNFGPRDELAYPHYQPITKPLNTSNHDSYSLFFGEPTLH